MLGYRHEKVMKRIETMLLSHLPVHLFGPGADRGHRRCRCFGGLIAVPENQVMSPFTPAW